MSTTMTGTAELDDLRERLKDVSALGSSVKVKDKQEQEVRKRRFTARTSFLSSSLFLVWIALLNSLIPSTNSVSFWRRLGPVPPDTSLGSNCKSSLQCLLFVPHSHCDWDNKTCSCQPYHIESNSSCLPASLLGYACAVDAQCTLKVPNSQCHEGVCQCKDNFVGYRKDKCLPPSKTDGYCLNDRQCFMGDRYSYCKYIIPRVYGKCKCPAGYKSLEGQCLPGLNKKCDRDEDCEAGTANSFCKLPSFRSATREAVCSCRAGFRASENKTKCVEVLSLLTATTTTTSTVSSLSASSSTPFITSFITSSITPSVTPSITPSVTPSITPSVTPSISSTPFVNISHATQDMPLVSLGKSCTRDIECQVRDPYSVCVNNICDCAHPTSKCSASNTGCHNDTFQCRNGQCISWYFVCDKTKNCDDGSDEEDCGSTRSCPSTAFACDDGTCLSRASVCNGRWECPDGSDEARCYKGVACDDKSFRCKSGQCLPQYTFCNAVTDCIDGSDEDEAVCEQSKQCPKGSFQCANNNKCRSTAILCSGVDGCGDNSDEDRCEVCFCNKPMVNRRFNSRRFKEHNSLRDFKKRKMPVRLPASLSRDIN